MTGRREHLDEIARQAAPVRDEQVIARLDPVARGALLEAISREPSTEPTPAAVPATRSIRRRRLATAAVGLAAAGVAAVAVASVIGSDDRPTGIPGPNQGTAGFPAGDPSDVLGAGMQCVEAYGPQTLSRRAFAFDGTVVKIGVPASGEEADPYVPVTFRVQQWFRGGDATEVTVAVIPPGRITSEGGGDYAVGDRLLVSGEPRFGGAPLDDPIAWACGFTRRYDPAVAQAWATAFGIA